MQNTIKRHNLEWINTLRALAILGVILIHICSPMINMTYNKNMDYWWLGNILNSAVRFAVPIFVMLSGATLLGKSFTLVEFYSRRLSRVVIPGVFWMLAYWVFRYYMLKPWQQPHGFEAILRWAVDLFVNESISVHLWYIYMIVFLYLFVPFINKIICSIPRKKLLIFIVLWVIYCTLHTLKVINTDSLPLFFKKLHGYSLYVGYLILGYYLKTIELKMPQRRLYLSFYMLTIVVASFSAYFWSLHVGKMNLSPLGTFTLTTMAQAITVFLLFKNLSIKWKPLLFVTNTISDYSFGIYLVHVMLLNSFFRIGIFWTMAPPYISLPLLGFITLISSIIIIYILRKIPILRSVAG